MSTEKGAYQVGEVWKIGDIGLHRELKVSRKANVRSDFTRKIWETGAAVFKGSIPLF